MPLPLLHHALSLCLIQGVLVLESSTPDPAHDTYSPSRQTSPPSSSSTDLLEAASFFTPLGHTRIGAEEFPLRIVHVGAPPAEMSLDEVEYAMRRSIATWSGVGCTEVRLEYGGHVDTIDELNVQDIPVVHLPRSQSPCLQLGQNTRVGSAPCIIDEARSAGVVLNRDSVRWYNLSDTVPELRRVHDMERPWVDLEATLTHELGHILGLAHPDAVSNPRAAMLGSYRIDGSQRRLSANDRATLCALYPSDSSPQSECESDGQCITRSKTPGATCVELGSWQVCDKEAGAPGDYCADNLLICEDFCLITHPQSMTGYCSIRCEEESQCPEQWTCSVPQPPSSPMAFPALSEEQRVCMPDTTRAEEQVGDDASGAGCQVAPWLSAGRQQKKEERHARAWWLLSIVGMLFVARKIRRS